MNRINKYLFALLRHRGVFIELSLFAIKKTRTHSHHLEKCLTKVKNSH